MTCDATGQFVKISLDGLNRLQLAVLDCARSELTRVAQGVIDKLRSRPPQRIYNEIKARHLWDEYCWTLQEGLFDTDMRTDDLRVGSLSDVFDDLVHAFAVNAVEELPNHAKTFLSALALENDEDSDENEPLGCIWVDGMVRLILAQVNDRAGQPHLSLLGPHRSDVVGSVISGSGMVWSTLSGRGEAMGLITDHVDSLIDPDGDLAELADVLVDRFLTAVDQDAEGAAADLMRSFGNQMRPLVLENDVLPSLSAIRAALLARLDP